MEILIDILAAAAGAMFIVGLIAFATFVFSLVCQWKIFVKMGEPGWKGLIPIYSHWVLCAHTWKTPMISLAIIIPIIVRIFVGGAIDILLDITIITLICITNWKKYKNFGKSTGFCVLGLILTLMTETVWSVVPCSIFFTIIPDAICAFGSATYSEEAIAE